MPRDPDEQPLDERGQGLRSPIDLLYTGGNHGKLVLKVRCCAPTSRSTSSATARRIGISPSATRGSATFPSMPPAAPRPRATAARWRLALGSDAGALDYVASPLVRARETMEIMRRAVGLPPDGYRTDDRLREIGYGHWEGELWGELPRQGPARLCRARGRQMGLAAAGRRELPGPVGARRGVVRRDRARCGGRRAWRRHARAARPQRRAWAR